MDTCIAKVNLKPIKKMKDKDIILPNIKCFNQNNKLVLSPHCQALFWELVSIPKFSLVVLMAQMIDMKMLSKET